MESGFPIRSCSAKMPEVNRFSLKRLRSGVTPSVTAARTIVIACEDGRRFNGRNFLDRIDGTYATGPLVVRRHGGRRRLPGFGRRRADRGAALAGGAAAARLDAGGRGGGAANDPSAAGQPRRRAHP